MSIISCITFSGSHNLALQGKHYGKGILEDLYKLRIDAGDVILKTHIEHGKKMQAIDRLKLSAFVEMCLRPIL